MKISNIDASGLCEIFLHKYRLVRFVVKVEGSAALWSELPRICVVNVTVTELTGF